MSINPLQLAVYKGVSGKWGAVQLSPQRPHYYVKSVPGLKNYDGKFIPDSWRETNPGLSKDDLTSREGCLFMEITSTTGKNEYDWENKITVALSVNDLSKLLVVLEGLAPEVKLMHDPGAKSASAGKVQKYVNLSSPQGIKEGCMLQVSEKKADGEMKKHTVPLTADEVCLLRTAVRGFIPVALAWL